MASELKLKETVLPATHVVPYKHAVFSSVAWRKPFWNPVVSKRWARDGRVMFLLESFNTIFAAPDEPLEVGEYSEGEYRPPDNAETVEEFLARRPEK